MYYSRFVTTFFVLIVISLVRGQEMGQPTCYELICPVGTTSCSKYMKSTMDKNYLNILVNCLDDTNNSLKTYKYQKANKFGPYTFYESTSFNNVAYDNNYLGKTNDELEDLS